MTSSGSDERRPGLFGVRRRLAESLTDSGLSSSKASLDSVRIPLDASTNSVEESAEAAIVADRLLKEACDHRNEILTSFHQFLDANALQATDAVDAISTDTARHIFERCSEQLNSHFGPRNVLLFRATRVDHTDTALLFRGTIETQDFDLVVSRIKFKTLLRYLERPSGAAGDVSQTLILLYPRFLNRRLIVPSAVVMVHD
ncbi:multidrug resistance-associated 4-like, putative [Babesia ovis]|uniref:Multidrug resistance-associated 4-like, putative n=1 Tax=Babesia ovis TaxID=5869 RepID=A0A9W5TF14_BABOV|nr:multidrug resistance-associated 4-like, putative [Babesia ovis]